MLRRLLRSVTDLGRLERAVEKAAKHKAPGWYEVSSIKVHKKNPIDFYVVELDPTTPPPGGGEG